MDPLSSFSDHPQAIEQTTQAPVSIANGELRKLDPKSVLVARISSLIGTATLGVATVIPLAAVLFSLPLSDGGRIAVVIGWLILGLITLVWGLIWPGVAYRYARFRVSEDGLEIRRGVLWRSVTFLPRSRVQHTDVLQGPIERAVGLARLVVHTAGTQNASVVLEGISQPIAAAIRDHLIETGTGDAV